MAFNSLCICGVSGFGGSGLHGIMGENGPWPWAFSLHALVALAADAKQKAETPHWTLRGWAAKMLNCGFGVAREHLTHTLRTAKRGTQRKFS